MTPLDRTTSTAPPGKEQSSCSATCARSSSAVSLAALIAVLVGSAVIPRDTAAAAVLSQPGKVGFRF